jgi:flagellar hook protein FlgE
MPLNNAMNSGVSGLMAEGQALGVVGDNVANSNTIGFKQSRALFEDVLGSAIGAPGAIGSGVHMTRAQQLFAQGSLLNTGQPTDLALSGDGFYVTRGSVDGVTGDFYTRAGQTNLAVDGSLVNPDGLAMVGYKANPNGSFGPGLAPVKLTTAALPPRPTSKLTLTANLDASSATPALPFDPLNPSATSNFSTSMSVYDSLGGAHSISIYAVNNGAGAWDYHALANGAEVAGGVPGTPVEIATGNLAFTPGGALQSVASTSSGTVDFVGAQPAQPVTLDFGTPIASGGTGLDGTTQFSSPNSVSSQSQDGYASGALSGVQVDGQGIVSGVYTNGQKVAVAQLAVAKFVSNDGLGRAGHNLWVATRESGDAALGTAGSGGRGAIVSGALEQSNVDIAQQFVDLIGHQRAFQASSKTITTVDEMMQDLVNLKR